MHSESLIISDPPDYRDPQETRWPDHAPWPIFGEAETIRFPEESVPDEYGHQSPIAWPE